MRKTNQPDMFAQPEEQGELFDAPAQKAYAPDPAHVRNRLGALLNQMQASETWPWDAAIVSLHRERTFGYLCALLPESERDAWLSRLRAETLRLDAASHVEPGIAAE
jgi:hypothetical protein